jgi:hypothetical protein
MGLLQRCLWASCNGARNYHRQIVEVDLALHDKALGRLDAQRLRSFAACLFSSATIASFSFSSSIRDVSNHCAASG